MIVERVDVDAILRFIFHNPPRLSAWVKPWVEMADVANAKTHASISLLAGEKRASVIHDGVELETADRGGME